MIAREVPATEMDRRIGLDPPSSWREVVDLGLGVARAILGEEPKPDPRPWVRGCDQSFVFSIRLFLWPLAVRGQQLRGRIGVKPTTKLGNARGGRGAWLRDKEVQ